MLKCCPEFNSTCGLAAQCSDKMRKYLVVGLVFSLFSALSLPLFAAAKVEKDSAVRPVVVRLEDQYKQVPMPESNLLNVAQLGEKLVYAIKWKGVPAGEATFTVKPWQTTVKGKSAYYLVLETESNDFVSTFYKVRDKVKSYIDAQTGHSLFFVRDIAEGKYRAKDFLEFDYNKKLQYYSAIKNKSKKIKKKPPLPIPGPLQDPLSVFYYLRHFPLQVNSSLKVLVGSRKRPGILKIDVLREEQLDLADIGTFNSFVISLGSGESNNSDYQPKIFVAKGKVTVWVEKNTNIPLMVRVGIPILGNADVVLRYLKNCKLANYKIK